MAEYPTDAAASPPSPPPDLPDELASALVELDALELRAVVEYAQSLLPTNPAPADLIEARPGENVLEVNEREVFTTVVKEQPCVEGCDDCPHGPYLYRVRTEIHPEADDPTLHWDFLGRVTSDDGSTDST